MALCSVAWLARVVPARAGDNATSGLAAAEQAYQEVDFQAMHDAAARALEAGGATHDETARLSVLVGISAAALGNEEEAKHAFVVALAVDPSLKLDRTLSPKVRQPYLEAKGYWGARPERLALNEHAAADGEHVVVALADPLHLAAKIVLRLRVRGAEAYEARTLDAARAVRFAVTPEARRRGYDFFATGEDAHGNVLVELGNDADPRTAEPHATAAAPSSNVPSGHVPQRRSYVLPIALGAAGVAATAVGVVFHVQREDAAREWNGPACEHPGETRLQQCGSVDSRRRLDQGIAIGAYSAAGSFLAGGAVAWFLGAPPAREAAPGTARTGVTSCGISGPALTCTGRF